MATRMSDADRRKLDDVFNAYDENRDGSLGRDEIGKMMRALGKSEPEIKAFIAAVDDDGDGTVSRQEFAVAMSTARLGSSEKDLKAAFDLFDGDGDGFIDVGEIKRQCGAFLSDDECDKLIKDVDVNGDGKIMLAEWIAAMKDMQTKAGVHTTHTHNTTQHEPSHAITPDADLIGSTVGRLVVCYDRVFPTRSLRQRASDDVRLSRCFCSARHSTPLDSPPLYVRSLSLFAQRFDLLLGRRSCSTAVRLCVRVRALCRLVGCSFCCVFACYGPFAGSFACPSVVHCFPS
jgi:Ca2+-binding EF-hand superfamily protein